VEERELVIRLSPNHHPYWWAGYPLIVLFWLGCVYVAAHPSALHAAFTGFLQTPGGALSLYAIIVLLPVGCVIGLVSARTSAVYLTHTHIGRTRFAHGPVECNRTDLARIVLFSEHHAPVSIYNPDGYKIPVIAFESRQGGELFRVTSRWWGLADIHKLAAACGVPVEGSWQDVRENNDQTR
jgi:hypothetical protein